MTDWIEVVNWERFQHYRDRQPPWIKNYSALLNKDEYLQLSGHVRAILHGLWLLYASSQCQVRADTRSLTRRLGLRVSPHHIVSLNQAGFIRIVDSAPLAIRARTEETETDTDPPLVPPLRGGIKPPSNKQLRKLTGCRWVRGSHGGRHIPDPLGTDPPPKDWPYGRPSRREVELAMEAEL